MRAAMSNVCAGSKGASQGARIAATAMRASVAAAAAAAGSPRNIATNRPGAHGASGAGATSAKATSEPGVALGIALPGVRRGGREVGQQGAKRDKGTRQHHDRKDEEI